MARKGPKEHAESKKEMAAEGEKMPAFMKKKMGSKKPMKKGAC
jgi:hypothetical protein